MGVPCQPGRHRGHKRCVADRRLPSVNEPSGRGSGLESILASGDQLRSSRDSLLERAGFEPSVPNDGLWALSWTPCNDPNARVINLSAMAICAMASSCNVAMEVGSAGAGRVRIETGSLYAAPPRSGMLRLSTSRIHISAREAPWFSLSSSAPRPTRTTPSSRAGARFEQVVACCAPRRPLLAVGRVCRCPNLSFAG